LARKKRLTIPIAALAVPMQIKSARRALPPWPESFDFHQTLESVFEKITTAHPPHG
jgi:hypothetical protein